MYNVKDNAEATLQSGVSSIWQTIMVEDWGHVRFPEVPFLAVLNKRDSDWKITKSEIVEVIAQEGDLYTINRGQQWTTATDFSAGDYFSLFVLAKHIQELQEWIEDNADSIVELEARADEMEDEIAWLQADSNTDHLEDRVLAWTSYTLDDLMFRQYTPTYDNSTNTVNVWDVAADTELHIQRQGSWNESNKLKLKAKMNGSPTTSLIVEVRKWIKVIEESWESYRYWDPNNIIASATLPYTTFSSSWQDLEITLDNTFWWTEWELLDIVVYQNNHIVNASNYYVLWVDSTQQSDAFQVLKVNGTTIKKTNLMPYCISDWFATVLWERVSNKWAYAKPRVLKEIWEVTRLTTFWRHIDWTWLDHVSESYIDYKPQRYKTITCYINEWTSDPAAAITLWDDCEDWTSADFDDFFELTPCLTDENWDIFKELNRNDYTKDIYWNDVSTYLDWTTWLYNAMVRFPRRGIKMDKDNNTNIITAQMTDNPSAYSDWFHYYAHTRWPVDLSAADTSAQEEQYAIDYFDIWIFKWYIKDWKLRSISWVIPTTNTYIYDFRSAAKQMWSDFGQSGFFQLWIRQLMWCFKYQNLNSQATLWRWFVDKTSWWSSTSCYTWATNSKWMDWWNTATWTDTTENRVKLRWIEDPWGNVWEWIDWLNISNYVAYVSLDFDNWVHDSFSAPYYNVWTCPSTSDKYITKVMWTTKWMFLPSANWWSDSTYYCDNMWINSGSRVALSGAARIDASKAGVFVRVLVYASSHRGADIGGRLMFQPSV